MGFVDRTEEPDHAPHDHAEPRERRSLAHELLPTLALTGRFCRLFLGANPFVVLRTLGAMLVGELAIAKRALGHE